MPKAGKSGKGRWDSTEDEELLRMHREHMGVYKRVAEMMGVDASYVSRVASGKRRNQAVRTALIKHLAEID
jgi:transcriptional regulator with XRE-family HTH domain